MNPAGPPPVAVPFAFTPRQRQIMIDVCRRSIRKGLGDSPAAGGAIEGADDPALRQPAGCFVSLHERRTHRLRGCVGRLDAAEPLLQCVSDTALSVLHDPRFLDQPVTARDLPWLEVEISVLSPLKPADDALAFDLLNDGIYLTFGEHGGCFLPQVARETGWSKEQLLDRLCTEKLGLPATAWRSGQARLSVFNTVILGPEPFYPAGAEG